MCCSACLRARRSRTAMALCGLPAKSTGRRMSSTGDARAVGLAQLGLDRPDPAGRAACARASSGKYVPGSRRPCSSG